MKEIYPLKLKAAGGIFVLCSSIVINSTIAASANEMREAAIDMMDIRSVSGNTIDEAFYQEMGNIYYCMADIIKNAAGIVLAVGIVLSVMILYPVIAEEIRNKKNHNDPNEHESVSKEHEQ